MNDIERNNVQAVFAANVDEHGWAVTPPVLSPSVLNELRAVCSVPDGHGGARNLLDLPPIQRLARSDEVRALAQAVLGEPCFAVRGLLFDKTSNDNWKVPWHQDVVVAVREQHDVEGFGPWSVKGGVLHVQAPTWVLERMIALRIHLDPCGQSNGPLRVLSGSHRAGLLTGSAIAQWTQQSPTIGLARAGAILGMRPLLLHASSIAQEPHHRRVIHLEFAAVELPAPLAWHWRI